MREQSLQPDEANNELTSCFDQEQVDLSADAEMLNAMIDGRAYSTSPTRALDGANILQDLDEMAGYADRIDSILDQQQQQQPALYESSFGSDQSSATGRFRRSPSPRLNYHLQQSTDNEVD